MRADVAPSAKNETMETVAVTADERQKLEDHLRKRFGAKTLSVRQRGKKTDSAEVYVGEEFAGVISKDEDDGELAYHFTMTILDIDLEDEG
jgi:Protein of unknown function (DUF3126)